MEYSAIKVKIGLKEDGAAKYPLFNDLQCVKDSGLDWSKYIDVNGLGWLYDKTSKHQDNTEDSPVGQQFGVLVVSSDFADQSIIAFPDEITSISEVELEAFYDNKSQVNAPEEIINTKIIEAIQLKQSLGLELTADQVKALDPEDDTPGITKNKNKKWADRKIKDGITIV